MKCPFLEDIEVRSCHAAGIRKLIPRAAAAAPEKCSSEEHVRCEVYRARGGAGRGSGRCPYLDDSLVQYCAAAAVRTLVPYSEAVATPCGTGGYRHCELYLQMARPDARAGEPRVDGIRVPECLDYSANHMWLETGEDGACYIGIDGFLARVLGQVERVSFLTAGGNARAAAVLTACGADLQVVFPNAMPIAALNTYLRANPAPLTADPYGAGWLFQARETGQARAGLIGGGEAKAWMQAEAARMTEFAYAAQCGTHPELGRTAPDGGVFEAGLAGRLGREDVLGLFHRFFSPYASWKREP
jgi:glycine cleavage system H protein